MWSCPRFYKADVQTVGLDGLSQALLSLENGRVGHFDGHVENSECCLQRYHGKETLFTRTSKTQLSFSHAASNRHRPLLDWNHIAQGLQVHADLLSQWFSECLHSSV